MSKTTRKPRPRRKIRYHIWNWRSYDCALVRRGSLTLWIDEKVLQHWRYQGPFQRGAQFRYSDLAIQCMLSLREVFHLPNRAVEGLVRSLFALLGVDLPVPDHTTLSRRGRRLQVRLPKKACGPLHLALDSSGLKVYGEGEWKVRQHGWSRRRTWRKLHLAVDPERHEIQAALLSPAGGHDAQAVPALLAQVERPIVHVAADGAYDRRSVYQALARASPEAAIAIPPRRDGRIWQQGNRHAPPLARDENLRFIRRHGRSCWKRQSGYHKRSLAETAVFRLKTIFGDRLSARRLDTQSTQALIRCCALHRMTHLGMPESIPVA